MEIYRSRSHRNRHARICRAFVKCLQGQDQLEEELRLAVYGFLKDAPEGAGPFISGRAGKISGFSARV